MDQQRKKTRYLDNLKSHILPRSRNQTDFNLARLEWELERIELSEELGNCPCGKENIREHCFIKNKYTRKLTYVGNVCVNKFLDIKTGNLFSGLKRVHKDPDARPNAELIKYAMKKGFIYGDNEYKFLNDIKNKRKLTDKQLSWLHKINRRITESIVVQRRTELPTDVVNCEGDENGDEDSDDDDNDDID